MKAVTLLACLFAARAMAQSDDVFVASTKPVSRLAPDMDTLTGGLVYNFQIIGINGAGIEAARFFGGRVEVGDSTLVVHPHRMERANRYWLELFAGRTDDVRPLLVKDFL